MSLFSEISADFHEIFEKDPAARSAVTVALTYSGLHALICHRIGHRIYNAGVPLIPAIISTVVKIICGIEIHPAAKIAGGVCIDHGVGLVIGETAEVGPGCLLYQGVTLGGTGKEKGKRHPTLGTGVVVGAGAKVLGAITIGDYAKIGANSVVLKPVPSHAIVVGVPGRVIKKKVLRLEDEGLVEMLDHVHMPDPVEERFVDLEARIAELERSHKATVEESKGAIMKVFNTMSGRKEEFIPITPGHVGIYACGVTVYDVCHIGHARSAIVFDMMRQYLRRKGLEVKFVKNFTDIDDKIINRARERGVAWDELARIYTEKYQVDMGALGVEPADVEPRATEHIKEIIELVSGLIERGHAYEVEGDVYFEINTYPSYGKLSGRTLDDMLAGARVDVDTRKRNPMDFALWKASKEGEPSWQSPWGPGRPGWHIECSAMSIKHLGPTFDIHGGGADLIFPHHENELAQSEAYTGKPFVKYWVHNGFITVDKEKMSKSLGNFFTIEEILARFDAEVIRLFLLQTHYRSPIEFSDEQLRETESSIDRFYLTISRCEGFCEGKGAKERTDGAAELGAVLSRFIPQWEAAMDDDFNTAMAVGYMFELIREINRFLDRKPSGEAANELVKKALSALKDTGTVLRVFQRTPGQWASALMRVKNIGMSEAEIEDKIRLRREAREAKDWAASDAIRAELDSRGIVLEDRASGTAWRIKAGA